MYYALEIKFSTQVNMITARVGMFITLTFLMLQFDTIYGCNEKTEQNMRYAFLKCVEEKNGYINMGPEMQFNVTCASKTCPVKLICF